MSTNRTNTGCWIAAGVLAVMTGGLLALGCERRDEPRDVAAAPVPEDARGAGEAASDYMKKQLAELEQSVAEAERGAKSEIEQARDKAESLPEATRQQLDAAIARTERASDDVGERLDELKGAGSAAWDTTRERVSAALQELSEARREVAAALRGERETG